jgi:hypothetical protein
MTTQQEKVLKPKLGLLELAKQLGNVSQACKIMGYSRDTFYRYQELYYKQLQKLVEEDRDADQVEEPWYTKRCGSYLTTCLL